jgi:hypothetical protein
LSSYVWERSDNDTTDTRHWQNMGTLSLRLDRIGGRDLVVAAALRGRYDVRNVGGNVDDYHAYNLYLRWRNLARRVDLTAGRHRTSWPSGSTAIDGASATVRFARYFDFSGYAGVIPPDDGRFKVQSGHEGRAFGLQLGARSAVVGDVAVFFAERHRARAYAEEEINNLAARTAGLSWRRTLPRIGSASGLFTYDLPRQRIDQVHLSGRWQATPALAVNLQYRYRQPNLDYNSIFWVFGGSRYHEGRIRLYWRLDANWSFSVGGALVDLGDDQVGRFDLGVTHRYFTATVYHQTGVSGQTSLSGSLSYPLNDRWLLRGGTRYASYELQEDQEEANTAGSWWLGVRWNCYSHATADLEAQFLSQDLKTIEDFAGDESDLRLLARITWWFFQRMGR